jgi:hypothetical protein
VNLFSLPNEPRWLSRYPIATTTIKKSGFESRQAIKTFLFSTASGRDLGPIKSLIQWVPENPSPELKHPELTTVLHLVTKSNVPTVVPRVPHYCSWLGAYLSIGTTLLSTSNSVRVIKSWGGGEMGEACRQIGDTRNAYKIVIRNPERKKQLRRHRYRCEDNTKMGLK